MHAVVQWGGESLGLPSQLDPRLSPQRSPSGNKALETYICKLGTTAFTHKKSACTETRCAPHRGKENEAKHVIATAFCLVAHGKDNSSQPLPYASPFTRVVSMPRVFDTHHLPTPISPSHGVEEKRNEKVKREKEPLRGALSLSLEVPPPLLACLSQTRLSFIYKRTAKEEEEEEKGRRSKALTLITFGIIELYVR